MAEFKLNRGTVANLITTGGAPGNAVLAAAGYSALSAEYDNETNLFPFGEFEINVTFSSAPTVGKAIELYLIPDNSSSGYTDGSDSIAPAANLLVGWTYVRAVGTAQRMTFRGPYGQRIELPPTAFKVLIKNAADTQIAANWTIDMYPYDWEQV